MEVDHCFSEVAHFRSSRHLNFLLNPFTTGNPVLGTKILGFSIRRGSGGPKGLSPKTDWDKNITTDRIRNPMT